MGLRIIYGESGSGKTEYCFNEIKEKINNKEKIYIITPEQFSFTAERHLIDKLEQKAVVNAEVLTFDRMAHRVFSEVGGSTKKILTESSTAMIISDILNEQKNNLTFLGKSSKTVDIVARMFTELKKHRVENKDLKDAINKTEDIYLKKKLEDILLLKENFEAHIPRNYMEGAQKLTMLAKQLEKSNMFDNTILYLDEFNGFTKQEYEIIRILLKKAKQFNITICTDCIEDNLQIYNDIFFSNKQTAIKLINLAKKEDIIIEKFIKLEEKHRFKTEELRFLEENIYKVKNEIYKNDVNNIEICLNLNPYSEVEHIAEKIIYLVREEKYRYRDIAIITKNIQDYSAITKAIFEQYEIPVFIDQKRDLSNNMLVRFLLSIFDIFAKNWSYEAVFTYLKTGLTNITEDEIYKLENYCQAWQIKGNRWYKDDWNFDNLDAEKLQEINDLRKKVTNPLLSFKEEIQNNKTVKGISTTIYNFLNEYGVIDKLQDKIQEYTNNDQFELANEYKTSINIIVELLDEMVNSFEDKKVTFERYREYLKTGLENKELGAIPGVQDEVIMGDVDRSRSHKVRACFILGMNDGVFPSSKREEGFINDKDREKLKSEGLELAKGTIEKMYDENFNIYKALSIAEEKLYISYTSTDKQGKSIRPSVLIINIKKLFPKLFEKSDIVQDDRKITLKTPTFNLLLEKIYKQKEGERIDDIWYFVYKYYENKLDWSEKLEFVLKGLNYTNLPEKINEDNIKKLYGKVLKTSVSKLEQYKKCPFSFHLKYGLKLKDPIETKVMSIDTGNFMHEVIDAFFEEIREEKIALEELSKEQLEEIVKKIINRKLEISKYYKLTSNSKYIVLTRKLKKTVLKSMEYIVSQLVNSKFDVLGTEIEFKNGGDYPPILLELEDNQKIQIEGKIDRVDFAMGEDGKYIRIIDYKSSAKKIDLNEVVYGLQIQLFTYLNEMSIQEQANPAGILYFNLKEALISCKKRLDEEEIENELKKIYKMQGIVLEDIKVIKMMDKTLDKGASSNIPVYIDKDENISTKLSSTLTKEEFNAVQKQVNRAIKEISKEILKGDVSIKPYYDKNKKTPCEYCLYKSICNFNTANKDNNYFYIPNLTKDEVLEELKKG